MRQIDLLYNSYDQYLKGGGEMGEKIRSFDWFQTDLGSPEEWSQSLLTSISILLKSKFPMFLWWGPQLIQFYNDAYRPSLGEEGKHPTALGQKGEECWPEIWPTIKPLIDQVMNDGESVWFEDMLIPIYRNGKLENVYWTFSYSKVDDETGKPGGVLVICNETTEKVISQQKILENLTQLQTLNVELVESNKQLALVNKALALKNIEFFNAEESLKIKVDELAKSETRLRYMLNDAPVAIAAFTGRDLIIESANDKLLEIWGRTKAVINMPLHLALPELKGQEFLGILDDVFTSGKPYYGNERKALIEQNNTLKEFYFTFVYQPLKDSLFQTIGILMVANDVTEQVNARRQLEFTIEAAELGTWEFYPVSNKFSANKQLRLWFGLSLTGDIDLQMAERSIIDSDRERVISALKRAAQKGSDGNFNEIYTILNPKSNSKKVIKAKGKALFDTEGNVYQYSGILQDITEEYKVQQKKEEFTSIASHELKTPLTSLKASLQLLERIVKNDSTSDKIPLFLSKATNNLNKLQNLFDDLMNVTKIQQGQLSLNKSWFNIVDLLNDCCEPLRLENTHEIIFNKQNKLMVYADYGRIDQVIVNLINNAVKYAPASNIIELEIDYDEENVKVSVIDFGLGISPEKLPYLFDRYYRVDSSGLQYSGLGLGLYICAEIINKHGGTISAESTLGAGSKFSFSIPINSQ